MQYYQNNTFSSMVNYFKDTIPWPLGWMGNSSVGKRPYQLTMTPQRFNCIFFFFFYSMISLLRLRLNTCIRCLHLWSDYPPSHLPAAPFFDNVTFATPWRCGPRQAHFKKVNKNNWSNEKKWDTFGIKSNFQAWWRNHYNKETSRNIFL